MKPQRALIAERTAAQHCEELLGRGRAPFDTEAACAEFAAELASGLPGQLARLLLGAEIQVSAGPGRSVSVKELIREQAGPATHFALSLSPGCPAFVVSCDHALALSLTERMFGGSGISPQEAPHRLPQSAALAVERIVGAVAQALAPLCAAEQADAEITSSSALRRLGLFWRNDRAFQWTLAISQQGAPSWDLRLAVPELALHAMLVSRSTNATAPGDRPEPDPMASAMAAIPLPVVAVLAELRVPLDRLAQLRPGDCIPFSPRRDVPLAIGGRVVASGTVGACDERSALRLTRLT